MRQQGTQKAGSIQLANSKAVPEYISLFAYSSLSNMRLSSILPTIQAKVTLILKNECLLIT
jgi:hypothetical protein